MKRTQFLRQMAFTVPVGIAAPQMLFAEKAKVETAIVLNDGHTEPHPLTAHLPQLNAAEIKRIGYRNGNFMLENTKGQQFTTAKLLLAGTLEMKDGFQHVYLTKQPNLVVEFGQDPRSNGILALTSFPMPQYHVRLRENFNAENLQQFMNRKRPALLQLA